MGEQVIPDAEKIIKDVLGMESKVLTEAMHQYGNELLSLLRKQVEERMQNIKDRVGHDYTKDYAEAKYNGMQEVLTLIDKLKKP